MLFGYAVSKKLEEIDNTISEMQNRINNLEEDVAELKKKVQSNPG